MPITASASISCDTVMEPSRAAKAEPLRPATTMPVISAPNSRVMDLAAATTTWLSAPNSDSAAMNWMPSMTPMVSDSSAMIGTASTPTWRICSNTMRSRTGWPRRQPQAVKYSDSASNMPAWPSAATAVTVRRPSRSSGRISASTSGPRALQGLDDPEHLVEPRQPQHRQHRIGGRQQHERLAAPARGLEALDQGGDAGGIDVADLAQVHGHAVGPGQGVQ